MYSENETQAIEREGIKTPTVGLIASDRRPEIDFLLLAARRYADGETRTRIEHLSRTDLDWPFVLTQAERHGIVSLLYFNLRRTDSAAPSSVMDTLAGMFRARANHNLYLLGQLLTILDEFERRKIAVIPFKGPVLAVTAFADVSLREFSDLDLLIQEPDLERARSALVELGFDLAHHPDWVSPYLRFGHELDFISRDGGFQIDLQWRFAKKWLAFPLDHSQVWSRTTLISVGGCVVRQLCLEDSLLLLCGHAYRHCWSSLKWISDVTAFLHAFGARLDWERLIDQARTSGGLRVLGLGLWLAHALGAAQLSNKAGRALLTDVQTVALGHQVLANLFVDNGHIAAHGAGGMLSEFAFHWRARERIGDRLPRPKPLFAHAEYHVRRYVRHYSRCLFGARDIVASHQAR